MKRENGKGATAMFYTEKRTEENKRRLRRDVFKMLLAMLPFFALRALRCATRRCARLG